jgi:hypothetical protein
MEYKAAPWEHALMIGWSGFFYGAFLGFVVGLVVKLIRGRSS